MYTKRESKLNQQLLLQHQQLTAGNEEIEDIFYKNGDAPRYL